jgi:methylated-DNA-[protein]-cysteine S-methyltransferase
MTTVATPTILASVMQTPIGPLTIVTADDQVCAGGFTDDLRIVGAFRGKALRSLPIELVGDLGPITADLTAYFEGDVRALDRIPIVVQGGAFQERVWAALRQIPPGQPTTYQHLARRLGGQRMARAVGMGCATNPVAPIVPCHRVTGTDGSLTGYYWGLDRKRWLLDHEMRHAPRAVAGTHGPSL